MRTVPAAFIVSVAIGVASSGAQVTLATPENLWIWQIITGGGFAVAAVFGGIASIQWWRGEETKPDHNLRLDTFVTGYLGRSAVFDGETHIEGQIQQVYDLFRELRQAARSAKIVVWGRPSQDFKRIDKPLVELTPSQWDELEFDALDYQYGGDHLEGRIIHTNPFKKGTEYTDVYFDRKQMARAFPKRWPKIRLKSPITLEKPP